MHTSIPGEDHLINFQKGDPYPKIDEGYARLLGAGYAALHPELEGINPEDYPDLTKLRILADVAPYSRDVRSQSQLPHLSRPGYAVYLPALSHPRHVLLLGQLGSSHPPSAPGHQVLRSDTSCHPRLVPHLSPQFRGSSIPAMQIPTTPTFSNPPAGLCI